MSPARPTSTNAAAKPQRCILYARISSDENDTRAGVNDQEADLRKHAKRLGWKVGRVIPENDTSAFKRKKVTLPNGERAMRVVRPGWRSMLDDLAAGRADGLLAVDLDRAARDPRDLEDLIDVVESPISKGLPRIPVESITGSLKLANDADITMARVMVAMANKSSRDTSRRVSRAALRRAEEGRPNGGPRRYGHEVDGSIRPDEAEVIVKATEAVLSGVGLAGIVKDLNARAVPPARSKRWTHQSLRDLLRQPRVAGLMAWNGELLEGVEACWEPIVDRPTWEAVCAVLNSPERRTTPGPKPRHLLSHLARCGHPSHDEDDRPVMIKGWAGGTRTGKSSPDRRASRIAALETKEAAGQLTRHDKSALSRLRKSSPEQLSEPQRVAVYRCVNSGHMACAQDALDDHIETVVVKRLAKRDAADLLAARPDVDVSALAKEANALRARLVELLDLVEDGTISAADYRPRRARLTEQLASMEAEMTAAAGTSPLAGIAGRPDADEVWDGFDLARKRAVIDSLMEITVLPAAKRGKGFDESRVRVDWQV